MSKPDTLSVMTVGSAMLDIIVIIADSDVERITMHNEALSYLLLEQGRKTEALSITDHTGGGAVNTAVALKRLGYKTKTLIKIGDDPDGERIRARLEDQGIDYSAILTCDAMPTGRAVMVSSHDKDATIFTQRGANTQLVPEDLDPKSFEGLDMVYITNLSNNSADCFPHIVRMAKDAGAQVAVNPGIRQLTSRSGPFLASLSRMDFLAINRREAEALVPSLISRVGDRKGTLSNMEEHPRLWRVGLEFGGFSMSLSGFFSVMQELGVERTVITDGGNGAYLSTADGVQFCPAVPTEVLGTVGAGDAFSSTLASGLIHGIDPVEALKRASVNAASVVREIDSQTALLSHAEINEKVSETDIKVLALSH